MLRHGVFYLKGKRAVGIEAESGGEVFSVEADEIIVSSGAIASPQLLMLSGIGPAEHLRSFGIDVVQELPRCGAEPARPSCRRRFVSRRWRPA